MKLNQNQLVDYLAKNPNNSPNFVWLNSEDSFLLQDSVKKIRKFANQNGFSDKVILHIDSNTSWDDIYNIIQTPNLFASQQLLELHFTHKITVKEHSELIKTAELLNSHSNYFCLVIYPFRVEAKVLKQKWMLSLDQKGLIITIWPLSAHEYPNWLRRLSQRYQLRFDSPSSFDFLCQKTFGNPGVAAQTLFKLKLQNAEIVTENLLNQILQEHANYNTFDLVDNYLLNNTKQCFVILEALKRMDTAPLLITWSLRKELILVAEILEQAACDKINPQQLLAFMG